MCASAAFALIAGCAPTGNEEPPPTLTATAPSPTHEALEGTQWEGTLDDNSLQLEFEDDSTVLVLSYNGLGPFDAETDVWQREGETLIVTLTGLFVDGEEQVTLDVTVSGEVDSAALVLEGEYSNGAEAVMELTPLAVS